MATVSGQLLFDALRTSVTASGMQAIGNVSIVLQDLNTGLMLAVLTDGTGSFSFTNVPNGSYQLVEAYGTPTTLIGIGSFANAVVMPFITQGAVPPISYIANPPVGATNLDSTIRITRLITVNNANLTAQNFLNGPVKYTPITNILDSDVIISPENLITDLDLGTFGAFPSGTVANTGVSPRPYLDLMTDFTYSLPNPAVVTPADGSFTIQNIMNNSHSNSVGTWWIISDRTTGNETGRMMVVNGFNPGAIILSGLVSILPNKYYLFTTWILNLCKLAGYADPSLGVNILDENGNVIFSEALGIEIPRSPNYPEWKEIGTVFYSENNHTITLQFISLGSAATGNDYVLDDIELHEVNIPTFLPVKTADSSEIQLGESVTYTVSLTNMGDNTLTNVNFLDVLPEGFIFNIGSVLVNGESYNDADPNVGFEVADIVGGETLAVSFSATATSLPTVNPTINSATFTYDNAPVQGGQPITFETISNEINVKIVAADLAITKTADKSTVYPDDIITYQINVINNGPDSAIEPMITDNIPAELKEVFYSLDNGLTWLIWNGFLTIADLEREVSFSFLIKGKVSHLAEKMITNIATVTSQIADPDLANNSSVLETIINPSADLSVIKSGSPNPVEVGSLLTYSITANNAGPNTATNVIITDTIAPEILNPEFSVDNGASWNVWTNQFSFPTLSALDMLNILIRGTISDLASGTIINNILISSDTFDPDLTNNQYSAENDIDTPQPFEADLAINKVTLQPNAIFGEEVTYYLTVTNNGPNDADNVIIVDNMPSLLLNQLFSIDSGLNWQAWNGRYSVGTLPNGATFLILIKGLLSPAATEDLENSALVFSSTPDPDLTNNAITIITPTSGLADLIVTKTALVDPIEAGEEITYQLTVNNSGPSFAYSVTLSDLLPTDLADSVYSDDGGLNWLSWTGSYELDSLANNGSFTILIRGKVLPGTSENLENMANVSSITYDPDLTNNQSKITTVVNEAADLSIIKSSEVNIVKAGELVTFRLRIDNYGPSEAKNVIVSDIISRRILNPEYSLDLGTTWLIWSDSINLGTVGVNTVIILLIRGTVASTAFRPIVNTATVASDISDPNPDNNSFRTSIDVIRLEADLSITKSASSLVVRAGDPINYILDIQNNGPDEAVNMVITDHVPLMITDVMYTINDGDIWLPWTGSFEVSALARGESISLMISGIVSTDFSGKIANLARVNSDTFDPDLTNNTGEINVSVRQLTADLAIFKTVLTNEPKANEMLTYQLYVVNNGPNNASNVIVTDAIAQGLNNPEFSVDNGTNWNSWQGSYTISELLVDSSQVILIRGIISSDYSGLINNLAIVNSDTFDPNFLDNISQANVNVSQKIADLAIVKTVVTSEPKANEILTYQLYVVNNGPNSASNVIVTDAIAQGLNNPEFSVDNGTNWNSWQGSYTISELLVDSSQVILIRGIISSDYSGLINNLAIVNSDTFDPNFLDNISQANVNVSQKIADMAIKKASNLSEVTLGEQIIYTLSINNLGPDNVSEAILYDNCINLTDPEYSVDNGLTWLTWNASLNMGAIAVNESLIVLLRGIVSANENFLVNTAKVLAEAFDPDFLNNSDTVVVSIKKELADISVNHSACSPCVRNCELVSFVILISNAGPSEAINVLLTHKLPKEIINPEYSVDNGKCFNKWFGNFHFPIINANTVKIIHIRGKVYANPGCIINSTAYAYADTEDSNLGNNKSTISLMVAKRLIPDSKCC